MALLTKEIWISTPLVLSIVVCVAPRLISYNVAQSKPSDRIVHETPWTTCQIVSYMGYGGRSWERKRKRGSPMYLRKYCSLIVTLPPFQDRRPRRRALYSSMRIRSLALLTASMRW